MPSAGSVSAGVFDGPGGRPLTDVAGQQPGEERRDLAEALLDGLPGVFYLYDAEGRFLRWNREFTRVTGYTDAEMAERHPLDFFAGEGRALLEARIAEVFEAGSSAVEADFVAKDGTRTPYYFTGVRTSLAGKDCLLGVGVDISARKAAEAALRGSERRLRLALDAAQMGAFEWDVDADRLTWSRRHEELWGYAPGEFDGTYAAFAARIHPDDLLSVDAELARCMAELDRFVHEFRVVWPDGSVHWVIGRGEFDSNDDGRPVRMCGMVFETTERREAAAAVEASEAHLRQLFEQAPDGLFIVDAEGDYIDVNQAGCDILGYSREELLRLNVTDVLVPGQADRRAVEAARLQGGSVASSEWWFRRRDGSRLLGEVTARQLADGSREAYLRDVTERRRAEEALRESERRLRTTMDNMSAGCQVLDGDWRFLYVNEAAERHNRRPKTELLGRRYAEMWPGIEETEVYRVLKRSLEERVVQYMENEFEYPDGERGWFELAVQPVPEGVLIQSTDITERKRAEREILRLNADLERRVRERTAELAAARDRAEEADRVKSAFLATMSHELRTPLNSVIGFTGILLQDLAGPLNEEQRRQLGMVQRSARHLLALINDVLDLSKIEAGQLAVSAEPFDADQLVARVMDTVAPLAEGKGLALRLEAEGTAGVLVSDERRVEQILLNLLGNAVKFTERGEVVLRVQPLDAPRPGVRFEVRDTGIGISPDDLATLFEPFRQLEAGLARRHGGTGLGLAICRRLADLLSAEVEAQSEPGAGSVFSVSLPRERE